MLAISLPDTHCQGEGPVSLAEFTLNSGSGQTFYDISLVDGYNLPLAILMQPNGDRRFTSIPRNLTNPSCVGTAGDLAPAPFDPYSGGQSFLGTDSSGRLPFESVVTVQQVSQWCPSNLEVSPLTAPSNGVYNYPDGNIQRPGFDPCLSACAKSHSPQDCCTGAFGSPGSCQPNSYSKTAKTICPDAYSYAFDDQTSTFIIPAGAGFEVIFCPGGRSTNILGTEKAALTALSQTGHAKRDIDGSLLSLEAPHLKDIPLAKLAGLNETDVRAWRIQHSNALKGGEGSTSQADPVRAALAQASLVNSWSQRRLWNGSGTLLAPDLKNSVRFYPRKPVDNGQKQQARPSSAAHRAHFVRQERMRSAFCLGVGMLVGAVGAWALL